MFNINKSSNENRKIILWLMTMLADPMKAITIFAVIGLVITSVYTYSHVIFNPAHLANNDKCVKTIAPPINLQLKNFLCSKAGYSIQKNKGAFLDAHISKNSLKKYFVSQQVDIAELFIENFLNKERKAALQRRTNVIHDAYARATMLTSGSSAYFNDTSPPLLPVFKALYSDKSSPEEKNFAVGTANIADVIDWFHPAACRAGRRVDNFNGEYPKKGINKIVASNPTGWATCDELLSIVRKVSRLLYNTQNLQYPDNVDNAALDKAGSNNSCTVDGTVPCVNKFREIFALYPADPTVSTISRLFYLAVEEDLLWQSALMGTSNLYSDLSFSFVWVDGSYWIWELIFWSWLGVLTKAVSTINAARTSKHTNGVSSYSPRLAIQTFPRLFTAPVVALIVTGSIMMGITGFEMSLANSPTLILFYFISGFASERFIDILKTAVRKLLPRIEVKNEKLDSLTRYLKPEVSNVENTETVSDLKSELKKYLSELSHNKIVLSEADATKEVKS